MPGVSSSKKRSRPALAAGMGASSRLRFSLLVLNPSPVLKLEIAGIKPGVG